MKLIQVKTGKECDKLFFKDIRKAQGFTQQYLAEQLGVCQSTIAMWETGKAVPSMKNLIKLSEVLGKSISDICTSFKKNRSA